MSVNIPISIIPALVCIQQKKERIRKTDYFQLALQTLRQHEDAVALLAEPIEDVDFDFNKKNNHCDDNVAHMKVKVKGSRNKGKMFFWATNNEQQGWMLDRLELELKSQPDKRYFIKNLRLKIEA